MLLRVEKEFNGTVTLASLFEEPTIEGLGSLLRHGAEPEKCYFNRLALSRHSFCFTSAVNWEIKSIRIGRFTDCGLMVQQLRKHDQEVSLLLLLDPTRSNSEVRITQFGGALGRLKNVGLGKAVRQAVMSRFSSVKHKIKVLICRAFLHAARLVPIALRQFYCIEVGRHTALQPEDLSRTCGFC